MKRQFRLLYPKHLPASTSMWVGGRRGGELRAVWWRMDAGEDEGSYGGDGRLLEFEVTHQ